MRIVTHLYFGLQKFPNAYSEPFSLRKFQNLRAQELPDRLTRPDPCLKKVGQVHEKIQIQSSKALTVTSRVPDMSELNQPSGRPREPRSLGQKLADLRLRCDFCSNRCRFHALEASVNEWAVRSMLSMRAAAVETVIQAPVFSRLIPKKFQATMKQAKFAWREGFPPETSCW